MRGLGNFIMDLIGSDRKAMQISSRTIEKNTLKHQLISFKNCEGGKKDINLSFKPDPEFGGPFVLEGAGNWEQG